MGSMIIIEVSLLIINFFTPVVFGIDENNAYYRGTYYLLFVIIGFGLVLYGYGYYIINKLMYTAKREYYIKHDRRHNRS